MPRIVDKEAKTEALVKAAVAVFARLGFHSSTMSEIAKEAGVGKGTLYEYFATKEELFLAVYDYWMSGFESRARTRFHEAPDLLSKADAVRETAVEFYSEHAGEATILLEFWAHALRSPDPRFLGRIHAMRTALHELGKNITEELVQAGLFVEVDADSLTHLETSVSDGLFLQWILEGKAFNLSGAYKFRQTVLGHGLLTDDGREILGGKLRRKLSEGFLRDSDEQQGDEQ